MSKACSAKESVNGMLIPSAAARFRSKGLSESERSDQGAQIDERQRPDIILRLSVRS